MTEKRNESGAVTGVSLTKVLNAPRGMVFKAWTDPNQVGEWWGPHRFTSRIRSWDAQKGGSIDIDMIGPDGTTFPMTGTFTDVTPPERIAFLNSPLDSAGKPLFEVLTTVTFEENGGRTTVTVNASVTKQGPDAGQYLKGMEAGWTQTIEKLDAFVATSPSRRMT